MFTRSLNESGNAVFSRFCNGPSLREVFNSGNGPRTKSSGLRGSFGSGQIGTCAAARCGRKKRRIKKATDGTAKR
jgi:hypothetical protein